MADSARDIINRAFWMIGAYRQGEVADGDDMKAALGILNELLESYAVNGLLLPYLETLSFPLVQGKGTYTIGKGFGADINARKIVELRYANFTMSDIRYPISIITQNVYNAGAMLKTLGVYPYNVLHQNTPDSSVLTFYPQPDQAYVCELKGKFVFDALELDDQLLEIPEFYKRFLRYALAREIADSKGKDITQRQEADYQQMKYQIENASDLDLTLADNFAEPAGAAAVRSGYYFL